MLIFRQNNMSLSQSIFLALIAITTLGAFLEATAHFKYRFTFGRFVVASILPLLWLTLIIFPRWEIFAAIPRNPFIWWPIVTMLAIFGPISFVDSIMVWVSAAMCGDLPNPLRQLGQKIGKIDTQLETKHSSIQHVVAKLREELGHISFEIVDHWEADLYAIGLARPDNSHVLVYISTFHLPEGEYFVSIELPPEEGDDIPYQPSGEFHNVDFRGLVGLIKRHLGS